MFWLLKRSVLNPVRLWQKSGALPHSRPADSSTRRSTPLVPSSLDALAVRYVGRYATTASRLAAYLNRKLRERGWAEEGEPPVEAIVERCVSLGYVDDRAFAEMRAGSLGRRGYGHRRVVQSLRAAGIDSAIADDLSPDEDAAQTAAETFARRRKFGRFANRAIDSTEHHRQVAAMMRAGHEYGTVRRFFDDAQK